MTVRFCCVFHCYYLFSEPGKHIALLFAKWETSIGEKERLMKQITDMEARHKEELDLKINQQQTESQDAVTEAVEKAKLEGLFVGLSVGWLIGCYDFCCFHHGGQLDNVVTDAHAKWCLVLQKVNMCEM